MPDKLPYKTQGFTFPVSPKMDDLYAMGAFGFMAVDLDRVNLDDLMNAEPGAIVRVRGNPADCIKFYSGDSDAVGCVAGWISEDD